MCRRPDRETALRNSKGGRPIRIARHRGWFGGIYRGVAGRMICVDLDPGALRWAEGWRAVGTEGRVQRAAIPQSGPAGWVVNVTQT